MLKFPICVPREKVELDPGIKIQRKFHSFLNSNNTTIIYKHIPTNIVEGWKEGKRQEREEERKGGRKGGGERGRKVEREGESNRMKEQNERIREGKRT